MCGCVCVAQVFLGAAAVTANGTVLSRTGTAAVAMVAHEWRMPVMICCETCKFQEKVQLDSICCNELGNPDAVSRVQGKPELRELQVRRGHAKLDAPPHGVFGSAGARAPCWVWPGSAWPPTGRCFAAAPLTTLTG